MNISSNWLFLGTSESILPLFRDAKLISILQISCQWIFWFLGPQNLTANICNTVKKKCCYVVSVTFTFNLKLCHMGDCSTSCSVRLLASANFNNILETYGYIDSNNSDLIPLTFEFDLMIKVEATYTIGNLWTRRNFRSLGVP